MRFNVVWFRRDFRVADHAPLTAAMRSGLPVVGVIAPTAADARRSTLRTRFEEDAIAELASWLTERNVPLVRSAGPLADHLLTLLPGHELGELHAYTDGGTEEVADAIRVQRVVRQRGGRFRDHGLQTLIASDDLPFPGDQTPDLFTAFRKRVEQFWSIRDALPVPRAATHRLEVTDHGWEPVSDEPRPDAIGGESVAWERLRTYVWERDRLRLYKETRNGLLSEDDSSRFSSHLAVGAISARQIYAEVKRYERERVANDSTYWLIFELLWRDFFRFQLAKYGPAFFRRGGIQRLELPWSRDANLFRAWESGQTGFPLVDASMRELLATGYTTNRARQNVASFFTKNLGLDWRMGAAFYETHLLDYDVASNWGNWMYQAGVGHDAREFRLFNFRKQSEQYDPSSEYLRHWCPELRRLSPGEARAPRDPDRLGYPRPIVDFDASARENRRAYERAVGAPSGKSRR